MLGWGHLGSASPAGYCWARETALSRSVPPCCAPQMLLQEEPFYHLDTTVRQQAMLAISSMRYLPYPSPQLGLPGRYQLGGIPGPRSEREADSRAGGATGFSPPQRRMSVSWEVEMPPRVWGSAQVSSPRVHLLLAGSEEHLSVLTAERGCFCRRRAAASSTPASAPPSTCLCRRTSMVPRLPSSPRYGTT